MVVLKKGMGPTKKKNKLFSKQNWNQCTKQKKIWWGPRILFYKYKNSLAKVCTKQAGSFFNLQDSRDYDFKLSQVAISNLSFLVCFLHTHIVCSCSCFLCLLCFVYFFQWRPVFFVCSVLFILFNGECQGWENPLLLAA